MTFGMTHAGFIIAAYGASVVTIIGLIVWIWMNHKALSRQLAAIEMRDGKGQ